MLLLLPLQAAHPHIVCCWFFFYRNNTYGCVTCFALLFIVFLPFMAAKAILLQQQQRRLTVMVVAANLPTKATTMQQHFALPPHIADSIRRRLSVVLEIFLCSCCCCSCFCCYCCILGNEHGKSRTVECQFKKHPAILAAQQEPANIHNWKQKYTEKIYSVKTKQINLNLTKKQPFKIFIFKYSF